LADGEELIEPLVHTLGLALGRLHHVVGFFPVLPALGTRIRQELFQPRRTSQLRRRYVFAMTLFLGLLGLGDMGKDGLAQVLMVAKNEGLLIPVGESRTAAAARRKHQL